MIITTFGLDLAFFERAVLPQISQARGRLILADADQLLAHQANAARGRMVRRLNRSYVAAGISVPGAAHAKVILLLGQSKGRLLVGSGNLRLTGWGAAGEMFTRYDVTDGDQASLPAFVQLREFLDGLAADRALDDFAAAYLDQIWSRTTWLSSAPADAQSGPVVHNLDRPILDQFEDALQGREQVADLLILAPFHDPDCVATASLIERTEAPWVSWRLPTYEMEEGPWQPSTLHRGGIRLR